jgi:type II restriction/modification system DNA methylase subunit YeeA
MAISLPEFVAKWQKVQLTESAASQEHFLDICELFQHPKPAQADPEGVEFTFERGVSKIGGGDGWADVWKRGYFGWEYKGKHKDLAAAYTQLLLYREDLENPPLLVTCDLDRFEVHTNFTNTPPVVYKFKLADLISNQPSDSCPRPPLDVLRDVFFNPFDLRPKQTTAGVTEEAAARFSELAKSLRERGVEPEKGAHFLMRLLFCLFSEDIGLLPDQIFTTTVKNNITKPDQFTARLKQLFAAMSSPNGSFGPFDIPYFNGGLFSDDTVYPLSVNDLELLADATKLDWGHVEPAIFGTLFERSLDPSKRSQLGAHYTSKDDIILIVEPVVMAPLRLRWAELKAQATTLSAKAATQSGGAKTTTLKKLRELLFGFSDELSKVRILDPACGSGNFLYVALKSLLDLEKELSTFAATNGLSGILPRTSPTQLYGIETNVYAHELASVVVWIGHLQWGHDNGFDMGDVPILKPLKNIRRMDAVLTYDANGKAVEPEWPDAECIIGNPPFLGAQWMREGLGDQYVEELRDLYKRLPGGVDFVVYWFEKAREAIKAKKAKRAGLLATSSIRDGNSNEVLKRIKESGDIFMAWSDRPWVLDGAAVRVSMVGFDDGAEKTRTLDGQPVAEINADLTTGTDYSSAAQLVENAGLVFQGPVKVGPFDISAALAAKMLDVPNPHGKPNSDVIKRTVNGFDIAKRSRDEWVIDFDEMNEGSAALYEAPFEYVKKHVKPVREKNRDRQRREAWWRLGRSGADLKKGSKGKKRVILTPRVAKHRLFVWAPADCIPDTRVYAFVRDDDYFFGLLHSRVHEIWTLNNCAWHGVGNDPTYVTSTCFMPFPLPWPPGKEPVGDWRVKAIADAAKELVEKRDAWLNPPGASLEELKKRTLTNLYNQRPQWLDNLHKTLDAAVLAAYGWLADLSDAEILEGLLALNHSRASGQVAARAAAEGGEAS